MSDIAVSVDHVSKRFRLYHERNQSLKSAIMRGRRSVHEDFWALKDVSFEVPTGSTFGLIGSNGSGKSTLLKCLAKIYFPQKGSITYNGKIAALLEVGSGFHPELSGRENVFLNGSILGMSKREITRKFDEIVDFSGVEQFIDQPVKNYSSGMYVRLGFAIAINVDPDVLVVDEVLSVGDAEFQEKCSQKFIDFKRAGKTVILVSHAMTAVQEMCDHAAWLRHGELVTVGEAEPTIAAYLDSLNRGETSAA
ncbi:ABC transporter ATP-binding protein [Cryobacterium sp. MDB2-10]|uniref:ABC transporter ATP-binding protein n=2 Tax=Microbacteriaceae TaxID=85023 RepID=A0ABY2IKQ9_9MICO|nr:ABC transporter ATP-binding protein [Cryobacterium sp. MDB2-A-1]TFC10937.1 ABC transporter ATP-binding protein [Cryobacterium sp. MDB2-A-2]TFC14414.1 ABC transporter ATP-binding protein [Cryobacterium sp. MDB2-10]TFC19378.1 ABC transporter ATP-binding protein [Cryobacterium glucosi]